MVLLQILGKSYGSFDVLGLRGLISSGKQHDQVSAALSAVDPVSRAKIDLQLADATREGAILAGIAVDEAVNTDLNTSATFKVSERVDLVAVDLGDPDPHGLSVAYELQMSRAERAARRGGLPGIFLLPFAGRVPPCRAGRPNARTYYIISLAEFS